MLQRFHALLHDVGAHRNRYGNYREVNLILEWSERLERTDTTLTVATVYDVKVEVVHSGGLLGTLGGGGGQCGTMPPRNGTAFDSRLFAVPKSTWTAALDTNFIARSTSGLVSLKLNSSGSSVLKSCINIFSIANELSSKLSDSSTNTSCRICSFSLPAYLPSRAIFIPLRRTCITKRY
ncbi:CUN056 hypothetical protein [Culex nigripalpus nucleopolyhedrovirus]|uniref:Uncharacterized protein n=1 Tax=Culex nigripalpus nucleopolyhedrovirus (isolate Florida/1997) TaxID=645993 RepID=Q919M1_NPVCO|nr:CUN056 hypothetical protein [Culex nigripalpus nucleopolyhedrovirus]AAK94134.1 CUN056 hypothetical protein [Culex nigripalpus nucleopolyhedrovirus]